MTEASTTRSQTGARPALDGIRVLTMECFIAGPTASMWLADMGAEVIKIEQPGTGDPARHLPPLRGEGKEERSLSLLRANRNKKSLTLNLKSKEGIEIFEKLIAESDVVLENLRPDALDKLGLTYERMKAINPRLIYTSISGFGHADMMAGPYTDWPAFDIVGQAMSGLMLRPERDTTDPAYLGFPLADILAGIVGATGTLQALFQRTITGVGQRVDIAMYDSALVFNELAMILNTTMGIIPAPGLHALSYPFGSFRARDGHVVIAALGQKIWERFCHAIGQPQWYDDPQLQSGVARNEQAHRLTPVINEWLGQRDRKDAVAHLIANGVPAAPIQDVDDIAKCPQVAARDMLVEFEDPAWGKVRTPGQPIKASGSPPPELRRPPGLGEHTDQLLRDVLGLDAGDLDRLRGSGTI